MNGDEHPRALMLHRGAGHDLQEFPCLIHRFPIEQFRPQIFRFDGDLVQHVHGVRCLCPPPSVSGAWPTSAASAGRSAAEESLDSKKRLRIASMTNGLDG